MNAATCAVELPDRITFRRPSDFPLVPYYAVRPPRARGVLVSVHGISRNAREHARVFADLAHRFEINLVCPLFEPDVFPDYQRLGRTRLGQRADLALDAVLEDFAAWGHTDTSRFDLFGFSGGAQFGHRYALAYPQRIRRLALTGPGWFTFPESPRRFPWGPRSTTRLPGVKFDVEGFLRIPTLVMVGRCDTERDASLRRGTRIDAEQGRHRVARARNWVRAVNRCASARRLPGPAVLRLLDDCGHDFAATMADERDRILFNFLHTKEQHHG